MINYLSKCYLTLFGLGYIPIAPGTIASLFAIILGGVVLSLDNGHIYVIFILLFLGSLGYFCLKASSFESNDPSEVVIDELVGQWVALWPLIIGKLILHSDLIMPKYMKYVFIIASHLNELIDLGFMTFFTADRYYVLALLVIFVLFRFFDIQKPLIIGTIDKKHTHMSIMMDDIVAGLFAGFVFLTLIFLFYVLSLSSGLAIID